MDINLLKKFHKGQCTPEEAELVMEWFKHAEDRGEHIDDLETYWETYEETSGHEHDPDLLLKNIQSRIQQEEQNEQLFAKPSKSGLTVKKYSNWLKIAAIVILGLGLTWATFNLFTNPEAATTTVAMVEKVAEGGKKIKITLSDGSVVTLNAESKLVYPKVFANEKREVILEGEAFFEVAHNKNSPFTITTQDIKTTVLGTSFNIKAYKTDTALSVAVATGKVKVSKDQTPQHTYFLEPGKEVRYQVATGDFKVDAYDPMEVLGWKDGMLVFKEASLQTVKTKLERWYGVQISIEGNDLGDWEYSGVFDKQSLEDVLQGMSYVHHFDYEIDEQNVKIIL